MSEWGVGKTGRLDPESGFIPGVVNLGFSICYALQSTHTTRVKYGEGAAMQITPFGIKRRNTGKRLIRKVGYEENGNTYAYRFF